MPGQHADRPMLHLSATRAWVVPPGLPRRVDLDLTALRLVGIVADGDLTGPADDCTAHVAGADGDFELHGPWIAIAWLGHLAGWPDPRGS
ncbi:hypothetical protein [Isoptericola sp. NPDC055881]